MWAPQVKSFKNNSILVYDLLGPWENTTY